MAINLSLIQKGLLVVTAPLVIEFGLIAILWQQVSSTQDQVSKQINSIARIRYAESLLHTASEIEFSVNDAFILDPEQTTAATDQIFLSRLTSQTASITQVAQNLNALAVSPQSAAEIREAIDIARQISQEISIVQSGMASEDASLRTRALRLGRSQFRKLTRKLYENLSILVESENKSTEQIVQKSVAAEKSLKSTLWAGMLVNLCVSVAVVVWFTTNIGSRIRILVANSIRLRDGLPLLPTLAGDDEVSGFDTAFRVMAASLAEARRRELAIINNTIDVIATLDRQGNIVNVSPSVLRNWGFSADYVLGQNLSNLVEISQKSKILETINELKSASNINRFEIKMMRSDGSPIDILWSCCALDDLLFCVAHDITERKKYEQVLATNERRVAQMLNSMPIGAMVVNDEGVIETANPSCQTIFALDKEELLGCPLGNLLTEQNTAAQLDWSELFALSNAKIAELFALRADHKRISVAVLTAEVPTLDHAQFIVNLADVSDVKEKEQRRKEFVLNTSHELRATLTSVHITLQLLATSGLIELSPDAAKVALNAERNSTKLLKLINDMLDSEKLEAGMLDLVADEHELNRVVIAALDRLETLTSEKEITIDSEGMGNFIVHVDADRIEQVFYNLIGNAIKFSPVGTSIRLKTALDEDANYLRVLIEDQGRGIPSNLHHLIFLRFQQVYAEDRQHGSGFGLSICKGIIDAHGGQIGVESEVGRGSRFWFTIPLAAPSKDC